MRDVLFVIRFFRIVTPLPPLMLPAFAGVGAAASLLVLLEPDRAGVAAVPLLLLQLFASSSGFMVPARRGHYDVLLAGGYQRLLIAAAHWAMSILPGVATWLAIAGAEAIVTGGSQRVLFTSGTVAALLLVSTIPWRATVALPRFTAAIGGLTALALLTVAVAPGGGRAGFDIAGSSSWWSAVPLAPTLYPPALVGNDVVALGARRGLPPLLLAAGSMIWALVWISRCDIPLEASQ
jgi:hypothetical protein